jgi:hypothetical protein
MSEPPGPTMTVSEVLARLSTEPNPDEIPAPSGWLHSAVWPFLLGLEHLQAVADHDNDKAAELAAEIVAESVRFVDNPGPVQQLLTRARRSVPELIGEGRQWCERVTQATGAWEQARKRLSAALTARQLKTVFGRPSDHLDVPKNGARFERVPAEFFVGPFEITRRKFILSDFPSSPIPLRRFYTDLRFETAEVLGLLGSSAEAAAAAAGPEPIVSEADP